jgi:phosphoglycolate phosphatase
VLCALRARKAALKKVILFDIDGTLIDSGEAGSKALDKTFADLFFIPNAFARVSCAGKTDIQIIKEGLLVHDLAHRDGTIPAIVKTYIRHLQNEVFNKRRRLMPAVIELLESLKQSGNYPLGLLTGNVREAAWLKLKPFGLYGYFSFGAYGDDSEDRNELLPVAMARFAEATGMSARYHDVVVIGDTPMDIQCSKPYGAVSIGVSTGPYSYDSLVKAGADYVLKDLTSAMSIIEKL